MLCHFSGGCSVEFGREDDIEYLDMNGVKALLRSSAFNQSDYVSIDHTMKRPPTTTKNY